MSQEDGWVVCRVFKKKYHRGFQQSEGGAAAGDHQEVDEDDQTLPADHHQHPMMITTMMTTTARTPPPGSIKQVLHHNILQTPLYDGHLPQLFSPEAIIPNHPSSTTGENVNCNSEILEGSHSLLRLTAPSTSILQPQERASSSFSTNGLYGTSDWSFLDKLLGSHHHYDNQPAPSKPTLASASYPYPSSVLEGASDTAAQPPHPPTSLFPFQYLGCDNSVDLFKFSK